MDPETGMRVKSAAEKAAEAEADDDDDGVAALLRDLEPRAAGSKVGVPLAVREVAELLRGGRAVLVDVRQPAGTVLP